MSSVMLAKIRSDNIFVGICSIAAVLLVKAGSPIFVLHHNNEH